MFKAQKYQAHQNNESLLMWRIRNGRVEVRGGG